MTDKHKFVALSVAAYMVCISPTFLIIWFAPEPYEWAWLPASLIGGFVWIKLSEPIYHWVIPRKK